MYCAKCGHVMEDDMMFCPECGEKVLLPDDTSRISCHPSSDDMCKSTDMIHTKNFMKLPRVLTEKWRRLEVMRNSRKSS